MQQAHNGIDNNNGGTLVRKGDARPHDVLMGRGHFNHTGNDRFLQIVSERQADYCAASYADKQQIADEVLQLVLDPTYLSGGSGGAGDCAYGPTSSLQPPPMPARFLQLESGDTRTDDCMFRIASGKAVDAKVKRNAKTKRRAPTANNQRNKSHSVRVQGTMAARLLVDTPNLPSTPPQMRISIGIIVVRMPICSVTMRFSRDCCNLPKKTALRIPPNRQSMLLMRPRRPDHQPPSIPPSAKMGPPHRG